jgi:hypothetical protein
MRGKYSPTVSKAYQRDPNWFEKYSQGHTFDPEGYDKYGYNINDVDRAGNEEYEYFSNDAPFDVDLDYNNKFDGAERAWTFDGVKPVRR